MKLYNKGDIHLDAVVVIGEVRQRRPVLAQCVVAGVGVVVVITVRNICRPDNNTSCLLLLNYLKVS